MESTAIWSSDQLALMGNGIVATAGCRSSFFIDVSSSTKDIQ